MALKLSYITRNHISSGLLNRVSLSVDLAAIWSRRTKGFGRSRKPGGWTAFDISVSSSYSAPNWCWMMKDKSATDIAWRSFMFCLGVLRPVDRIRLLMHCVTRQFRLDEMVKLKLMETYYVLHNPFIRDDLLKNWYGRYWEDPSGV